IEILRQPWPNEIPAGCTTNSCFANITQGRLYTIAQIRVLINDTNATGVFPTPGTPVRLANVAPYLGGSFTAPMYGGSLAKGAQCTPSASTYCGTAFAEAMTQQNTSSGTGNSCLGGPPSPSPGPPSPLSAGSTFGPACIYEPGLGPNPPGNASAGGACSNASGTLAAGLTGTITGCGGGCWHSAAATTTVT